MVTLNKPSAGATDWTGAVNSNWTTIESGLNLLKNYLDGLQISVTSATQVSIAAGRCRDKDDSLDIILASADTVDVTVASDRDFTEAASTWYFVWVIADSTGTNSPRGFLSSSSTQPTYPSGYDKGRRVGAVRNDASSNFLEGVTRGNDRSRLFWYKSSQTILNGVANQTAWQTASLSAFIPSTSTLVYVGLGVNAPGGSQTLDARRNGDTSGAWNNTLSVHCGSANQDTSNAGLLASDGSQQIQWKNDVAVAVNNYMWLLGYYDDL